MHFLIRSKFYFTITRYESWDSHYPICIINYKPSCHLFVNNHRIYPLTCGWFSFKFIRLTYTVRRVYWIVSIRTRMTSCPLLGRGRFATDYTYFSTPVVRNSETTQASLLLNIYIFVCDIDVPILHAIFCWIPFIIRIPTCGTFYEIKRIVFYSIL